MSNARPEISNSSIHGVLEKGLSGSAKVIQAEARYRLKEGYGIRVFGNPEQLDDWLKTSGNSTSSRKPYWKGAEEDET